MGIVSFAVLSVSIRLGGDGSLERADVASAGLVLILELQIWLSFGRGNSAPRKSSSAVFLSTTVSHVPPKYVFVVTAETNNPLTTLSQPTYNITHPQHNLSTTHSADAHNGSSFISPRAQGGRVLCRPPRPQVLPRGKPIHQADHASARVAEDEPYLGRNALCLYSPALSNRRRHPAVSA